MPSVVSRRSPRVLSQSLIFRAFRAPFCNGRRCGGRPRSTLHAGPGRNWPMCAFRHDSATFTTSRLTHTGSGLPTRAVWGISVREQTARLHGLMRLSMRILPIGSAWLVAACLAALAVYIVPHGLDANRLLAIANDPPAIAAHALDTRFDAQTATAGIEQALAEHD